MTGVSFSAWLGGEGRGGVEWGEVDWGPARVGSGALIYKYLSQSFPENDSV